MNWFYSAFAQSNAAIVGILCAFIISRVLAHQRAYSQNKNKIRHKISESEYIKSFISKKAKLNYTSPEAQPMLKNINNIILLLNEVENNPEYNPSIAVIVYLTYILFLIGTIIPLTLLLYNAENKTSYTLTTLIELLQTLPGYILLIVSIIFLGILWYINRIARKLRHNQNEIKKLKYYSKNDNYFN